MTRIVPPDEYLVIGHGPAQGRDGRGGRLEIYLCTSEREAARVHKRLAALGLTVRLGAVRDILGP